MLPFPFHFSMGSNVFLFFFLFFSFLFFFFFGNVGRMSHNDAIGFLGSVVAAAFTAYAIRDIPPQQWGKKMMTEIIPKADKYVKDTGRNYDLYQEGWKYFVDHWKAYLTLRQLTEGGPPQFPPNYGVAERDQFYTSISMNGWGGASGHDSTIIALVLLIPHKRTPRSKFCFLPFLF